MPSLDAHFAAQATGGRFMGLAPEEPFSAVGSDSRSISQGQLFVALKGPNFDGHDFVAQAMELGAAGALVRQGFCLPELPQACLIEVEDTLAALGDLAAAWRREHSALLAAVTGSNGKTTSKEMLACILERRHRLLKTQGNLNNLIGLPLTLLQLTDNHTACVLEMGMNAPGEIARLTQIAAPEVGLITNVGPAHIGMLGSMKAIALAKTELFRGLEPSATALVNLDDPLLAPWARKLDCRVLTFGFHEKAQVRGRDLSALGTRQAFTLDLPQGDPLRVRLAAPGRHNVMNALGAAATAWAMGQGGQAIKEGIEEFKPVKGRLNLFMRPGGPTLVDDTYNANPASLAAGLDALMAIAGKRRTALILGDMFELGDHAAKLHRESGRLAAQKGCALVLALGANAGQVARGAVEGGLEASAALAFDQVDDLIAAGLSLLGEGDVALIKGSRGMAMERVVKALAAGEER